MRKKATILLCIMMIGAAVLTGCGNQIPEMSQERSDEIAQYAADLLISSKAGNMKLMNAKAETAKRVEAAKKKAELAAKVDAWEKAQKQNQSGSQNTASSESSANAQAGQTASGSAPGAPAAGEAASQTMPAAAASSSGASEGASGGASGAGSTVNAASAQPGDIASFFNMSGLTIAFDGYELNDTYTDESTGGQDGGPTIKATDGVQFLIVKLKVSNPTSADVDADVISQKASFRITANGNQGGASLMTLMPGDFSLLKEKIAAQSSQDYVLITQVSSDLKTLDKLNLTIQKDQSAISINLK